MAAVLNLEHATLVLTLEQFARLAGLVKNSAAVVNMDHANLIFVGKELTPDVLPAAIRTKAG